jgi:hypothetical protein
MRHKPGPTAAGRTQSTRKGAKLAAEATAHEVDGREPEKKSAKWLPAAEPALGTLPQDVRTYSELGKVTLFGKVEAPLGRQTRRRPATSAPQFPAAPPAGQEAAPAPSRESAYFSEAMSITKRYFTSLFSMRS